MTNKPGVVLVHGAWHSSSHFENIIRDLEQKGYSVEAPTLPTVGLEVVEDSLVKAIAVVSCFNRQRVLTHTDSNAPAQVKQAISNVTSSGRNAVVICHSFGGIMGSEAVAEFEEEMRANHASSKHGHVVQLLYISAIIIERGVQWNKESDEPHAVELKDGLIHHLEPIERFYNTMEPALAQQCSEKLLPQVLNAGMTPTRFRGWADYGIPVTYVACEQDMALRIDGAQSKFIKRFENAGVKDFRVERIDCDHTPWLSNGQSEFFRILWDVLGKASSIGTSQL